MCVLHLQREFPLLQDSSRWLEGKNLSLVREDLVADPEGIQNCYIFMGNVDKTQVKLTK